MQEEILERHPAKPLKVYAVWYAMYPGDARSKWRSSVLGDDRVAHWWDEERVVGRRILAELPRYAPHRARGSREFRGDILWDAYLLFAPDARWEQSPEGLVSWGYTIMTARAELAKHVEALIRTPARSGTTR